jgi:hypothetical protein
MSVDGAYARVLCGLALLRAWRFSTIFAPLFAT